ncbi:hypothetical protein [Nonomuraea sp. NPDC050643]|uniref:hypothetical protein n=1 Tax=Nonomuraea sp. NPDC050643 TaxID=3155660 RepID=UPI0033E45413
MSDDNTCGTKFIDEETYETTTCNREGPHIVHRESASGTRFVRAPGGAAFSKPSHKKEQST